jgi:predicted nucleic acid-binding protein
MRKYLLDTNICIYHIKGLYGIDKQILEIGIESCGGLVLPVFMN